MPNKSAHDLEPPRLVNATFVDELSASWAVEELGKNAFLEQEVVVLARDSNEGEPRLQSLAVEERSQAWLGLCVGATVGALVGIGLGLIVTADGAGAAMAWIVDAAIIGACVGSALGLVGGMLRLRFVIETSGRAFRPAAFLVGVRASTSRLEPARRALRAAGARIVLVQTPRDAFQDFQNPIAHHPRSRQLAERSADTRWTGAANDRVVSIRSAVSLAHHAKFVSRSSNQGWP